MATSRRDRETGGPPSCLSIVGPSPTAYDELGLGVPPTRYATLLALRNDVGLLAEEYDSAGKRLIGNFPQALSHLALVNSALLLSDELDKTPAHHNGRRARNVRDPAQASASTRIS
jgi:hypothetical protein